MNEEEGRTPIYFVMGLGDPFAKRRCSRNRKDGTMKNVIPFPIKVEIPQTEEETKKVWFGHGKRGKEGWKILAFFNTMQIWVIDPASYDLGSTIDEARQAAKLFSDKAMKGGDDFIGMSLPFRARFPMMVPDSMEQLMADDPFGNEAP